MENEKPEYISVRDASKLTGVGKDTLYKMAKQQGFPCIKIGSRFYIHRERILDWMKDHEGREIVIE